MAKKTFFVCTVKNEVGDRFTYAFEEPNYYNLDYFCKPPRGESDVWYEMLFVCDTKRDAIETAKNYNKVWEDGGHLMENPPIYYRAIFA